LPRLWLIVSGIAIAVLFAGSLFAAYHQKLTIQNVAVEGNKTVDDMAISAVIEEELAGKYFWIYPKRNALIYPAGEIVASVGAAFPRLSSIELAEDDFQNLRLKVAERKGEYLWCLPDESCYFADSNGFVFALAPKFSGHLYLEIWSGKATDPVGRQVMPAADFNRLVGFYRGLSAALAGSPLDEGAIYRVEPGNLNDWDFVAAGPGEHTWRIRFDASADLGLALASAQSVLADPNFVAELKENVNRLEYLDLRFAPKIFYRFAD
jgi:hypothetical protein